MTAPTWSLVHPAADLVARYRAEGHWTDETFPSVAAAGLADHAAAAFTIRSRVRPYEGTIGDLAAAGRRLAGALAARGVGPGDVVAFQLPNWSEAMVCTYGLLFLGAVQVPIVHIYGHHEVGHILRESGAKVLVTADRFGHQDFLANLDEMADDLADLERVVVVDGHGGARPVGPESIVWEELLADAVPLADLPSVDPDEPVAIGYTSGTTAAPKGVIHSHRSLLAEVRGYPRFREDDPGHPGDRPNISGSPISHITGMLLALGPLNDGGATHLVDVWDPGVVLDAMANEGIDMAGGATFFLTSLLDHPDFDPERHLPSMRRVGLGGSPIPVEVGRRAAALGISLTRAYGSTEHPSITMSSHADPEVTRLTTDGRAMPGVEIRTVGDDAHDVGPGAPGEILSRGPDLFVGYTDPAMTRDAIDADGWYHTGDIGVLDADGYLTITDRKKDVIIRGGENISPAEVEEELLALAGVSEVAVVAAPDPRYGEHGCAFVSLAPGATEFALSDVQVRLEEAGLARQKWPEQLRFVDSFPRTASGKIRKNVLRERLRTEGGPGGS